MEQLRPQIKTGDFGNGFKIEGLDPHRSDDIFIKRPGFVSNITQGLSYGCGDFIIEKIKVDFGIQPLFDTIIKVPKVLNKGVSDNAYNFGWLNSKSNSKFATVISDYKMRVTMRGKQELRNGQTYIKWTSIKITPKFSQIKMRMDNAFPDRALNEAVNNFLNQNIEIVKPEIEQAIISTQSELNPFLTFKIRIHHSSIYIHSSTMARRSIQNIWQLSPECY